MSMHSNDFEEKFDAFLEDKSYDLASEALFHVVRAAFTAGWEAAGGTPHAPYRLPEFSLCKTSPSLRKKPR